MRIACALALILVACGGKKDEPAAPTCAQVTDHLLSLMELPNHPSMQLGNKKQMVQQCLDRKEDAKTLTCQNAAKSMREAAACSTGGVPHFRPRPPVDNGSGSGSAGSGSATGSGSGS
jgi:hypothetical protein